MDPPPLYPLFPHSSPTTATAAPAPTAPPPPLAPTPAPPAPPSPAPPPPHNRVAHAANATPTAPQPLNHPPYAEMIYAAITALKERDGSSRRAIAKYIEKAYTGLPPTHSALLTHHLKRLKSSGLLVMVKKSYKLPRSDFPNNNNPPVNNATSQTATAASSATAAAQPSLHPHPVAAVPSPTQPGPKRGRGRPPKPRLDGHPQVNGQPVATSQPVLAQHAAAAQPVFVSLGLVDDPTEAVAKRRPGRPKKVGGQAGPVMVARKGRGRPPKSGVAGPKKGPGRPRKPKSVGGVKKGRPGRPPKVVPQEPNLINVPYTGGAETAPDAAALFNVPRPRGRPKKVAGQAAVDAAVGAGVVPPVKRPGRPPKLAKVMIPKKSTGRPVGRPRKSANISWIMTEASQSRQHAEAYGDLKNKLEFFQSRVKDAVGMLKPHLTGAAISAVVAIQELEGLVAMDINTPLAAEPQPPQPQPQPRPQPQPQPQHQPQQAQAQAQPQPQAQPQQQQQPQLQLQLQSQPHVLKN